MKVITITPEQYTEAVREFINALPDHERNQHSVRHYLTNARYGFRPNIKWQFTVPISVGFVVNRDVQWNAPHTMRNIVILPEHIMNDDLTVICHHEILHIYFRYFTSPGLRHFATSLGFCIVQRPQYRDEITNPDTLPAKHVALISRWGLISPVVIAPNYCRFVTKHGNKWRPSTQTEKQYYNNVLPYPQNYHPQEILCHLLTSL